MWYSFLADVTVGAHLAYVLFVILGQLVIVVGVLCKWGWVRNLWFRVLHLLAIVFVAFEAIIDMECPMTVWERELRAAAGQEVNEGSFIGRLMHDLLFYEGPPWVFTTCYIAFALLVLATFVLAPPRWRKQSFPSRTPEPLPQ
jgi:hypothetical protein